MLLINYGGNLNVINEKLMTPLAYGNKRLLQLLNLQSGVLKVKNEDQLFDNNDLLKGGDEKSTDIDET